jgi:serine/threonine-protein kinase HipA
LLAGEDGVRLSLAGAQSKLPLRRVDQGWTLSTTRIPSTHILKPEPRDYPGLVAVEAFCLDLAEAADIPVVEHEVLRFEDLPVLCVKRYDREADAEGKIHRIHQEDLCQSLGIPPHRKYQQEGGPGVPDVVGCIRDWSSVPVLDLRYVIDLLLFNVMVGNADAHGKNLSWIYAGNTRRLAPAYDLVATTLWPELSTRLAMRMGRAKFVNEVTKDHLAAWAGSCGLGVPLVKERAALLCQKVVERLDQTLGRQTTLPTAHATALREGIRRRICRLTDCAGTATPPSEAH